MRTLPAFLGVVLCAGAQGFSPPDVGDAFARLQRLAGEWQADLGGFGTLSNSIRLVSNGKAVEETIGTPADNETSLYSRDNGRVLLTHFCALTPDGHLVRLETGRLRGVPESLDFVLAGSTNLHRPAAAHMRRVSLTFIDQNHFSEKWTKTENGKDTVFDLHWVRR